MADDNYHDYVIKNGKFIGRFEEMYQRCCDPWNQDNENLIYKQLSLELLKILGYHKFNRILDIGCGKGRFTKSIKDTFADAEVCGIDISETAVKVAKKRYPDIIFKSVDITKDSLNYARYDCIIMTECIWYILPHLKDILSQIHDGLKTSKGVFVLNNHLYQDSEQKYGREYITTIETLMEKLPFKIEYIVENNRFEDYDVTIICKPSN